MNSKQPKTMQHTFTNSILLTHFAKTPPTPGANRLIDLPDDVFLETEEEINLIVAVMWCLSIKYDQLEEDARPKNKDDLKKWIGKNKLSIIDGHNAKVEPPFTAWTIDQVQKDVQGMMEEVLNKTVPPPDEKKDRPEKQSEKK